MCHGVLENAKNDVDDVELGELVGRPHWVVFLEAFATSEEVAQGLPHADVLSLEFLLGIVRLRAIVCFQAPYPKRLFIAVVLLFVVRLVFINVSDLVVEFPEVLSARGILKNEFSKILICILRHYQTAS